MKYLFYFLAFFSLIFSIQFLDVLQDFNLFLLCIGLFLFFLFGALIWQQKDI